MRECTTHADCAAKHGDNFMCRPSDGTCVGLLTSNCKKVFGSYQQDGAVLFGSIAKGTASANVLATLEFAFGEFDKATGGGVTTSAGAHRPAALLECTYGDTEDPVPVAKFLAETLQVPAIIGPGTSSVALTIAQSATIPDGVLLIPPNATSPAITETPSNGLLMRVQPSDRLQGQVMAQLIPGLEAQIKGAATSPPPIKVAIVNKGDTYGQALSASILSSIQFNGKDGLANAADRNLIQQQYANTDTNPNYDFTPDISAIVAYQPSIIMLVGTSEISKVLSGVEANWGTGTRPLWVLSDGAIATVVYTAVQNAPNSNDLRSRIRGTYPGNSKQPNWVGMVSRFKTAFPSLTPNAAWYDAGWLMLYSGATLRDKDVITGADIASGIKRLLPPGAKVDIGPDGVANALPILASGANIDFNGATGPLDYDAHGEVVSDYDIWCMTKNGSTGALSRASSGEIFSAATSSLQGTYVQCP